MDGWVDNDSGSPWSLYHMVSEKTACGGWVGYLVIVPQDGQEYLVLQSIPRDPTDTAAGEESLDWAWVLGLHGSQ